MPKDLFFVVVSPKCLEYLVREAISLICLTVL